MLAESVAKKMMMKLYMMQTRLGHTLFLYLSALLVLYIPRLEDTFNGILYRLRNVQVGTTHTHTPTFIHILNTNI